MIRFRWSTHLALLVCGFALVMSRIGQGAESDTSPPLRTWTDSTGKHSTKGAFLGVRDERVRLKKEDGQIREIPLSKLCPEDRRVAEEMQSRLNSGSKAVANEQKAGQKLPTATSLVGVVYLDQSRDWANRFGDKPHGDLLSQEIVRQSLLMAARNELGLTTRDAWLGDTMPTQGNNAPFDLLPAPGEPTSVDIVRGFGSQTAIAKVELKLGQDVNYGKLLGDVEKLTRGNFVKTLKAAGFQGKAHKWNPHAAVPHDVEELLTPMAFVSQFHAVRRLHELCKTEGESPALLGALVRGYGNLGMLTEYYWYPAHQVFKARALLYAQRLAVRDKNSVWAKWHKAYALATAGLPAAALAEIASAEKAANAAETPDLPARPTWVDLISAYCRYDLEKLRPVDSNPAATNLALLLLCRLLEQSDCWEMAIQGALMAARKVPECYRVHDGICRFGGVSIGHNATILGLVIAGKDLYPRVDLIPGVPAGVRDLIRLRPSADDPATMKSIGPKTRAVALPVKEFELRARLAAALRKASEPSSTGTSDFDAGEPSWATLGRLIQELDFVQVWRRAKFERYSWSVSADDFLEASASLVADHPYRAFIATHAWEEQAQLAARKELANVTPYAIEIQAWSLCDAVSHVDAKKSNDWKDLARRHAAATDRELGLLLNNIPETERIATARKLLKVSPHSPQAKAYLVVHDWEHVERQASEWEKNAATQPEVLKVLGEQYLAAGQMSDAERCLKAAVNASPTVTYYRALAEMYRKQDKMDLWVSTLEKILKQPDFALTHAQVQKEIAEYFMGLRQWEKALPYAEGAAESYAAWALSCAAHCYEGLQRWDDAEKMYRAVSDRYRGSEQEWYFFCKRTGHGDIASARRLFQEACDRWESSPNGINPVFAAVCEMLERRPEKVIPFAAKSFTRTGNPMMGLLLALCSDEIKDAKQRDSALSEIETRGRKFILSSIRRPREELIALAKIISADLAKGGKGEIDLAEAEKSAPPAGNDEQIAYYYVLGKYFDLHGKRESAIDCWKKCMGAARFDDQARVLAGAELVEHRVKPEEYKSLLDRAPAIGEKPTKP